MKKVEDLKKLSKEDMEKRLEELRKALMKANTQISTGTPPENPGQVRAVKRNIARLITFIKEKPEEVENQNK